MLTIIDLIPIRIVAAVLAALAAAVIIGAGLQAMRNAARDTQRELEDDRCFFASCKSAHALPIGTGASSRPSRVTVFTRMRCVGVS